MKRLYLTLLMAVLISPGMAFSQATDTSRFTLEKCIQYALENSVSTKNARIDAQIAEARVKETVGIGLPQISADVALQHNQKLPRFFGTGQTAENFGVDLAQAGIKTTDVIALQNFFQLKSSGNASVTINQLLFNSSYLVGLKAASTYKELAYKSEEQTQIQVVQNVIKAYYTVLINKERVQLFESNIGRVDSLLRNTEALNKNGFAESIDVDRIQVTLNNLKIERNNFVNLQELSLQLLKFQMNYPQEQPLSVEGDITTVSADMDVAAYEQGWQYQNRIEYKVLDTQRRLQELDIKNKYSASLPSLNAFANLGYSTQSPNVGGLFKTNTPISDNGTLGPDKWYSFTSFGISLNVPLFSGLQRTYQIQQAKLNLLKIENSFTTLRQSIDLGIRQSRVTYTNAMQTLKSQEENMQLADRVAKITKIKYQQGVGSNIEVTDAENSLRTAQVNYYSALFDAMVAKIDMDIAYAKITPTTYVTPK